MLVPIKMSILSLIANRDHSSLLESKIQLMLIKIFKIHILLLKFLPLLKYIHGMRRRKILWLMQRKRTLQKGQLQWWHRGAELGSTEPEVTWTPDCHLVKTVTICTNTISIAAREVASTVVWRRRIWAWWAHLLHNWECINLLRETNAISHTIHWSMTRTSLRLPLFLSHHSLGIPMCNQKKAFKRTNWWWCKAPLTATKLRVG